MAPNHKERTTSFFFLSFFSLFVNYYRLPYTRPYSFFVLFSPRLTGQKEQRTKQARTKAVKETRVE